MNPDDVVLVALLNDPRDLQIVERESWYRIPARHAPKYFSGAQYLAFYLPSAFGERKWTIDTYAPVRGHELARRRDLFPQESEHPRADELYYKLQLGRLEKREPPIKSKRGRRVLFVWTTWEKFANATEFNDLFDRTPAHDKLWNLLKGDALDIEREIMIKEGRSRYRVDFLIYCPKGEISISIGGDMKRAQASRKRRLFYFTPNDIQEHFDRVLTEIRHAAHEMGETYQELAA